MLSWGFIVNNQKSRQTGRLGFITSILLAISILLGGCAGKPNSLSETTSTNPQQSQQSPVELTFWHIQTTPDAKKSIDDALVRFMAKNPQYHVQAEAMQNDAYKTKLVIAMGANSMPDMFVHWSGGPMISYVNAGQVADITEYISRDGYRDTFMPAAIEQATYQDKIWAIPVESVAICMFFYNKDIFEKYGIAVPKTVAELEQACDLLKENGITPFSLANKTKWTGSMYYMYLVDRIGGASVFQNAANRTGGSFEDEAFTKAGQTIQRWVQNGYFNQGFNGLDEDSGQSRALLYAGKAAMTLMGSWFIGNVQTENPDFLNKLGHFPFPAVEGGLGDPSATVGTIGDNFYSVSATSKSIEGSFLALQSLLDEQAVKERLAIGKIPPLKGVSIEDPVLQAVMDLAQQAKTNQLWYDQYLSPEMGTLHKDTCQALFGLEITPEQLNLTMEQKAAELSK